MTDLLREIVEEYEFGAYYPNERERLMLEDFARGLLADDRLLLAIVEPLVHRDPPKDTAEGRLVLALSEVIESREKERLGSSLTGNSDA